MSALNGGCIGIGTKADAGHPFICDFDSPGAWPIRRAKAPAGGDANRSIGRKS